MGIGPPVSDANAFPFPAGTGAKRAPKRAEKRYAPATRRNHEVISALLREILPDSGHVLEIASGTGEHIVDFASKFANLHWQPSDREEAALSSISAWRAEALENGGHDNIAPPIYLDVECDWPRLNQMAAILCINMLHISPWTAAQALFGAAPAILPVGAPLFVYGPFLRADVETAQSNLNFDLSLKQRNPLWGLRHVDDVATLARDCGFSAPQIHEMPANNLSIIFRRE